MRYIYTVLFYLFLPIIMLRLMWRSLRAPQYRSRIAERFGFYPIKLEQSIWLHAVSMGETLAAVPLINALLKQYPQYPILITNMTPTGSERVVKIFGQRVQNVYLPYDIPDAIERFLNAITPRLALIMETELWPNLLAHSQKRGIPICLLNARLSANSARGYKRIPSITQEMLHCFTAIAAHGKQDAERFIALGARPDQVQVCGNIKFDLIIPEVVKAKGAVLKTMLSTDRFVWIAASTHEGEEEIILAAHQQLLKLVPNALLILVPRHPERFNQVAKLASQLFMIKRRSKQDKVTLATQVYIGDTMGEMLILFQACDVAFVAGSLVARGGHNILEPAALGKPVISGTSTFNFAEIVDQFKINEAIVLVQDVDQLSKTLTKLAQDDAYRNTLGKNALHVFQNNQGALSKQLKLIDSILKNELAGLQ